MGTWSSTRTYSPRPRSGVCSISSSQCSRPWMTGPTRSCARRFRPIPMTRMGGRAVARCSTALTPPPTPMPEPSHFVPMSQRSRRRADSSPIGELDDAASALAAQLRLAGKSLGLCLATGVEAIVGIVAAWKCRSPYVPLDPSWPAARIDHILEETGARICLGRNFAVDVKQLPIPDVERVSVNRIEARPTDLAYIIYTSGSTGEPKGVMIPHRGVAHLEAALDNAVYAAKVRRPGRIGIFGALSFDTSVKQIVRLLRGDCLCPIPQELKASPKRLAQHLNRAELDVVDHDPVVAADLARCRARAPRTCSSASPAE